MASRLVVGRISVFCSALMALIVSLATMPAETQEGFPFDRTLVLEAAAMRPVKRVPSMTVESDGSATIDLWCRTVRARFMLNDAAVKIELEPLPSGLPSMMVDGQCAPPRLQADEDLYVSLVQSTGWRIEGSLVVFDGATPLRFRAASN